MAKYRFLAILVAFTCWEDEVYRMTMRRLIALTKTLEVNSSGVNWAGRELFQLKRDLESVAGWFSSGGATNMIQWAELESAKSLRSTDLAMNTQ